MKYRKTYDAIDNFRLVAAVLIVAIHTAPLASFSDTADFLVTYCLGRIGVPFFLMVSGYFRAGSVSEKQVVRPWKGIAGNLEISEKNDDSLCGFHAALPAVKNLFR